MKISVQAVVHAAKPAQKVREYIPSKTGTVKPKPWSSIRVTALDAACVQRFARLVRLPILIEKHLH